jgi:hypothetical protein
VIGESSGISAVFDEGGDSREAQLFIAGGLARMAKRPEQREAKQQNDDRRDERPRANVWLAWTGAKFG